MSELILLTEPVLSFIKSCKYFNSLLIITRQFHCLTNTLARNKDIQRKIKEVEVILSPQFLSHYI